LHNRKGPTHERGARHERHERPHNVDEARENDGFAAVLLEERVGALHVRAVDQARRDFAPVGRADYSGTDDAAGSVIDGVSCERRDREQGERDDRIELPRGGQRADCKQQ
jgi:hypothetical protein